MSPWRALASYPRRVSFLRWFYRLPGRINRSFASTAAAADVEGAGIGPQMNAVGVTVVTEEIKNATSS